MSTCTAEEIAEKKRIALEKLKAKKLQSNNINNNNKTEIPTRLPSGIKIKTSNCSLIQNINKNSEHCLKSIDNDNVNHETVNSQDIKETNNEASSFLNALRSSQLLVQRHQQTRSPTTARDVAHPYKRPAATVSVTKSIPKEQTLVKGVAPVFVKATTCKVYLISSKRFEVQSSEYHAKLIEVFKTIPSKSYDANTRCWSFSLNDYHLLQERLVPLKPNVITGVIPKAVLDLCNDPLEDIDKSCLISIEPTLVEKLLPFQKDGVCFAIAQQGKALICDEMGLGKTYQAIAIADFYKEDWPLLISTTASTRDSWAKHIRELLPALPLHYVQVLNSNQQYLGDAKIVITSYNMMERHMSKLMECDFGFVIFDESHNLKNSKAKCTMVADRLSKQAKHVILLSGTPALSRPAELFSQLQMVDRKFMNFIEFTTRYCDGKQGKFGWDATGQSNLKELNVILKLKYMIRRTKAEVLQDLSEKLRETVVLDPALVWSNDAVKANLNQVANRLQCSRDHEREEILLKFYAQTAEVKIKAVCAYVKQLVTESRKFIVFAHHRVMLNGICECLDKLKVHYVRIDGATRKEERGEFIETFQTQSTCRVAVLSLVACNSGITLTAADLIVFAELTWNPSTLAQAESRVHRIGQQKPVTCRYLMATNTADDHIWQMLKNKQDVLNKAGIFCDNLQDATHKAGPITSNKIDKYFTPTKCPPNKNCDLISPTSGNANIVRQHFVNDISKELENIEELFQDDDAFKDILC